MIVAIGADAAGITLHRIVAGIALVAGSVLVLAGFLHLLLRERSARRAPAPSGSEGAAAAKHLNAPEVQTGTLPPAAVPLLLFLVVSVGAWLRVHGLDAQSLAHTEGMLPNLPWPQWAWPPPRYSFYDAFWWHFHSELHPPAHYLLMWGWTNLFGTSLTSLRLPSALFGVGAIILVFRIGLLTHGRFTGLLAAAFVAFNGFQISTSQYARVYAMGTFLMLLSTLALLRVMQDGTHRGRWEATYLLATWLAIYTQTFAWLVLAIQLGWVALQTGRTEAFVRRVVTLQALVIMLGAPAIMHQLYQGTSSDYPAAGFLEDYLLFGFAWTPDVLSIPQRALPLPAYWLLVALASILIVLGLAARGRAHRDAASHAAAAAPTGIPTMATLLIAAGSTLVTSGFVVVALRRQALLAPIIALPMVAVLLPPVCGRLRSALHPRTGREPWQRRLRRLNAPAALVALLALLPVLGLLVLAVHTSVLNPRAFTGFAAFLLITAAAGSVALARSRLVAVLLLFLLGLVHAGSVLHWRDYPLEARDYRALSAGMNERMRANDLLFVQPLNHTITPLYYYLNDRGYTYVPGDYAAAVAAGDDARVWLVYFESYRWGPETATDEMLKALAGFRLADRVDALRARAELYVRSTD